MNIILKTITYFNNKINKKLTYIYNNIYTFDLVDLLLYIVLIILFFPVLYLFTGILTLIKSKPIILIEKLGGICGTNWEEEGPHREDIIKIDPRLRLAELPGVLIHELFHTLFPQLHENEEKKKKKKKGEAKRKKKKNSFFMIFFVYYTPPTPVDQLSAESFKELLP